MQTHPAVRQGSNWRPTASSSASLPTRLDIPKPPLPPPLSLELGRRRLRPAVAGTAAETRGRLPLHVFLMHGSRTERRRRRRNRRRRCRRARRLQVSQIRTELGRLSATRVSALSRPQPAAAPQRPRRLPPSRQPAQDRGARSPPAVQVDREDRDGRAGFRLPAAPGGPARHPVPSCLDAALRRLRPGRSLLALLPAPPSPPISSRLPPR